MSSASDPVLLEMFRAEVDQHMAVLSDGLLALERDPDQPSSFALLMRAAHSIKGAAKVMDMLPAVTIAHEIENIFVAAAEGRLTLTSALVDAVLGGLDLLGTATQVDLASAPSELDGRIDTFLRQVASLARGDGVSPNHAPSDPAPPSADTTSFRQPVGALDAQWVQDHQADLQAALREDASPIQLDLSAVDSIDPIGLALLATLTGHHQQTSPTVFLAGITPRWATLFAATGIHVCSSAGAEEP